MNWKQRIGITLVATLAVLTAIWMILPALVLAPIIGGWLWWQSRKLNFNVETKNESTNHNYTRSNNHQS